MDFGDAIREMRQGRRVRRTGWWAGNPNIPESLFVYLVPAASYPVQTGAAAAFFGNDTLVPYNEYFAMKRPDNTVSTWAPSVGDALADDWVGLD